MKKEISIEKIIIKVGEETFELTPEEAKDLKFQLDGFIKEYIPYIPYVPYYPLTPVCPHVVPAEIYYPPYEITWGTGNTYTGDADIQWSYTAH